MSPASTSGLDRRQRKTRVALHAALLQLIGQRPYTRITVDDIVRTADLARATFYAHFRDKDDLFAATNAQLMTELMATVEDVSWRNPPTYSGLGVMTILRHVDQHRDLYRVLVTGEGGMAARDVLIQTFTTTATAVFTPATEQRHEKPRLPMPMVTTAFVGALLLTIEQWLRGGIDAGADELAVRFMQGQAGGLEWALGFEPGDLTYAPEA